MFSLRIVLSANLSTLTPDTSNIYWRSLTNQTKSPSISRKTQDWWYWRNSCVRLGIWLLIASVFIAALPERVFAQITPDNTLPDNSTVTRDGNIFNINGGTRAGSNLFHSFSEFSVTNGSTAAFNNAVDIQNIISRVTGNSVSNIDGIIRAAGTANLFLLNPNGIIFAQGASLKIGGSFLASTASSLKFADGTEFNAIAPQRTPLLTISVPIGLQQYTENIGDILVQGIGGFLGSVQGIGLILPEAKTLALVGGNLTLDRAFLNVPGGRIELGSVAGVGQVNLNPTLEGWTLNYQDMQNFGNIQLSRSFVDAAIGRNSNIQNPAEERAISIRASHLDLRQSSIIRANTFTSAMGADINIDVRRLTMREGATVSTGTFSTGWGGKLTVNATESVEVSGTIAGFNFLTSLTAGTLGVGKGGSLSIKTHTLSVRDGAQVSTGTYSTGQAGNITVDATNIQLNGSGSGLFASTESIGNAGDLSVKTHTLVARNGAQVSAATFGAGNGGILTVDAIDIQLIGRSLDRLFPSALIASTGRNSTGDAGDLKINTHSLLVQDGAGVNVQSLGTGSAGNIILNAQSIRLKNIGYLNASTRSPKVDPNREQATININSRDLIMSRNASIRTNATGENVIGGNINIDTDVLVGFENSDISANSANFRGGKVRINAAGIFGIQFRDVTSNRTSDITATGGSPELSGTVEINTTIDPAQGLTELPTEIIDVSELIAQDFCRVVGKDSEFVVTGRGGLPSSPNEPLRANAPWEDLRLLEESKPAVSKLPPASRSEQPKMKDNQPQPIIEAQGWISAPNGNVLLTAKPVTVTPQGLWLHPLDCQQWKQSSNS